MIKFEWTLSSAATIGAWVLLGSTLALAQQTSQSQGMPGMTMTQSNSANPEIRAFSEANAKMHRAMSAPLTGKADWDFRSCYDTPDSGSWGGENIFDVHSKSDGVALNGEKYRDW